MMMKAEQAINKPGESSTSPLLYKAPAKWDSLENIRGSRKPRASAGQTPSISIKDPSNIPNLVRVESSEHPNVQEANQ